MKKSIGSALIAVALSGLFPASLARGATLEENRKIVQEAFAALPNISGSNLYYLQTLAEGLPDKGDPATVETYDSLAPDARKKLAANFLSKIKDEPALAKLAKELSRETGKTMTAEEARKIISDRLRSRDDVSSGNLLFLKLLSQGKSWAEASDGKRKNPEWLESFELLAPDNRIKLALEYTAKINNQEALTNLAKEMAKDNPRPKKAAPDMTPEEAHKQIAESLEAVPDVTAKNLLFIKGLGDGKTEKEADTLKKIDPDTLATYEALSPEARKKLATRFASQIKDHAILVRLAKELLREKEYHEKKK